MRVREAMSPNEAAGNGKTSSVVFPRRSKWEYRDEEDIYVSTYGIPPEFSAAFLTILLATRTLYRSLFGGRTIEQVELNVRKSPALPHRLWTNGADRVYLTLNRKIQLDAPRRSGVFNVYGLTHELAHIVQYRSIINIGELGDGWGEGWATYLASFVAVPHLYESFGPALWPFHHDYLETDGPARVLRTINAPKRRGDPPIVVVLRTLRMLDEGLGREGFARFFRGLLATPIRADHLQVRVEERRREIEAKGRGGEVVGTSPPRSGPSRARRDRA